MAEFRALGRDAFIERYSPGRPKFTRSRDFFVVENGIGYDSKPLAAAAYGFQHGRRRALESDDFSGGEPVIQVLGALGFNVSRWTSPHLEVGAVYPRAVLRAQFKITDATLNTGVFRPADTNSIWLFITRDKAKDRTQYINTWDGDLLHWQGQTEGLKDSQVINHEVAGDELLVFYRDSKHQHPGAGFRYEGAFRYLSHTGAKPASFTLQRATDHQDADDPEGDYDPTSIVDGRKQIWAQIKRRQGQPAFRRKLLLAYGGRCAITDCTVVALLEAAHITPYLGKDTNVVQNGLLLRADIHTLFDLGLIAIRDDGLVVVSAKLVGTEYQCLGTKTLRPPADASDRPSSKALQSHRSAHNLDA
ncbi:MAG: HNH endonuclease [Alphaproteobacteria bacterium]|nr:MAG: HNH endonuclease [Alphaproteobacteria bacterium]